MATIKDLGAGHWRIHVYLGRSTTGKTEMKAVTVCPPGCVNPRHGRNPRHDGSRRGRERLLRSIEEEQRERWRTRSSGGIPETMDVAFERWLTYRTKMKSITPSTVVGYRSRWQTRSRDQFGATHPADITAPRLAAYRDGLHNKLSASTINQDLAILSGVLKFAVEQGWLDRQPKISRAQMGASDTQTPDEDDVVV